MAIAKLFDKTICKCERCGHEWMPKKDEVFTCPKCRSPYWNKPKKISGIKPDVIIFDDLTNIKPDKLTASQTVILDESAQQIAALQCAIVQNFDCEHYKKRISATALCKACFECDFWTTNKVKMLKEAFSEHGTEEMKPEIKPKKEIKIQGNEIFDEFDDIQKQSIKKQTAESDNTNLPKTPEEILASLEQREIKIEGRQKTANKEELKILCYSCREKYQDGQNDWQCNFFTYKSAPKFDYCRLCWELPEIWSDRAVGPKK